MIMDNLRKTSHYPLDSELIGERMLNADLKLLILCSKAFRLEILLSENLGTDICPFTASL